MNDLIKKLKYNILYDRVNYPLLQLTSEDDYVFFKDDLLLFKQKDTVTTENFGKIKKKYKTIILENIKTFPSEILSIINEDSIIYSFSDTKDSNEEFFKYFKFVKINEIGLNLYFSPLKSYKTYLEINTQTENKIFLTVASNIKISEINYTVKISMSYLNSYLKTKFTDKNTYENLKEKFNKNEKLKNALLVKQKIIKQAIEELYESLNKNNQKIIKLKLKLNQYISYIHLLLNNTKKENSPSNHYEEIKLLEKTIKLNSELINQETNFNKKLAQAYNKPQSAPPVLKIEKTSVNELKKLYNENKELIEQNNLYVSEISNLKFDIEELTEKNNDLIRTINELEVQLRIFDEKKEEEISLIKKELSENHNEKLNTLKTQNEELKNQLEELNKRLENLGNKNIKNLKIIDEKNVLLQKLKLYEEKLKEELRLKEELVNKKNMIIREKDNRITVLEDKIENMELNIKNLKFELEDYNNKINSNYYKELYDNLERKYKNMKIKNKELLNKVNDYKKEIDEYEIKLQELSGYNERIIKDIEIDIEDI